jgi:hypothetical protein
VLKYTLFVIEDSNEQEDVLNDEYEVIFEEQNI